MNCPKCGNPISEGAVFCRNCGASISNAVENAIPIQNQGKVCPNCGKIISESATFCRYCGQSIDQAISFDQTEKKSGTKSSKKPLVIVGIIVALAAVIGCVVYFSNNAADKTAPAPAVSDTSSDTASVTPAVSTETSSNTGALNDLVAIIDETEKISGKANEDFKAVQTDTSNPSPGWHERSEILAKAILDIKAQKDKASQIQGLDQKAIDARDSYFEMSIGRMEKMHDITTFLEAYFKFDYAGRPDYTQYDSVQAYYNDLYSWYSNNKKSIDSLESVPSSVEVEWNRYKEVFELNDDVVDKEYFAYQLDDILRYYSGINLTERIDKADLKCFDDMIDAATGGRDFALHQGSVATKLADELKSYAQMNDDARKDYEFENNKKNKITIKYDTVETIYPSLYNTYDAFVIIKTGCVSGTRRIVVEAEIPGFTQKFKQTYDLDSSYKAIHIKPPALTSGLDLSTAKQAQLNVSVYEKDGTQLIESKSFPVTIKSRNDFEWYSDEFGLATTDNILCFLTPDAKEIDALKREAISKIHDISGGKIDSFVGYQSTGYNHYVGTYIQAAGIMRALYDMGVRYDNAMFSISGSNQRIKLPAEVLNNKSGLCIETSLTVASALQNAGMHAFLVLPTSHAQVAVEVWDGQMSADENGSIVEKGEGQGEYFLIETTYLSEDSNNDEIFREYANALMSENPDDLKTNWPIAYYSASEWANYIKENNAYIIDCNDSKLLGLTEFAY